MPGRDLSRQTGVINGGAKTRRDSHAGASKTVWEPSRRLPEGRLRAGITQYVHDNTGISPSLGGACECKSCGLNNLRDIFGEPGLVVSSGIQSSPRLIAITG